LLINVTVNQFKGVFPRTTVKVSESRGEKKGRTDGRSPCHEPCDASAAKGGMEGLNIRTCPSVEKRTILGLSAFGVHSHLRDDNNQGGKESELCLEGTS